MLEDGNQDQASHSPSFVNMNLASIWKDSEVKKKNSGGVQKLKAESLKASKQFKSRSGSFGNESKEATNSKIENIRNVEDRGVGTDEEE